MLKKRQRIKQLIASFLLVIWSTACQPSWHLPVTDQSGFTSQITNKDVSYYLEKSNQPGESIPLGQLLYHLGYTLIETITLETSNRDPHVYIWDEIAASTLISDSGVIEIENQRYKPHLIHVKRSDHTIEINYSIMDIAPTIAFVMGLPKLADSDGQVLKIHSGGWEHAVMIVLDGLQYEKLETAFNEGTLPFFKKIDMPQKGLTVYPPITNSATAAVLTGTPPQINGVYGYGYRSTEQTTLFDLAANAGKSVVVIEGASLPFNLQNAEITLSGDRDGNGFSDDNVFMNSLYVIQNNMPDLLYIHFHEIDDMGHTYGPDSQQYLSALQRVDEYLFQIYKALPANTFIVIFADHGMHATMDGGNHGTLTEEDLVIPIMFLEK